MESEIEIEKTILQTAGKPVKIQLTADRTKIKANGQDLSFITVEILDKEGILEPNADNQLTFGLHILIRENQQSAQRIP